MNDIREGTETVRPRRSLATYLLSGLALIGAVAALYVIVHPHSKPGAAGELHSLARGEMKGLSTASAGAPSPTTPFIDAEGHTVRLDQLKGRILVINLWATWCAPCVREMPTLAKLQLAYPGKILVVPISMDKAGDREKARAFIAGDPPLPFYQDEASAMPFALTPAAEGFPTTVIYGADGREKARVSGDADWSGADAHAVFDALTKGG